MISVVIAYTLAISIVSIGAILGLSHLFAELRRQRQPGLILKVWRVPSIEELQAYGLALVILALAAIALYGIGVVATSVIPRVVVSIGPLGSLAIGGVIGLTLLKILGLAGRRSLGV